MPLSKAEEQLMKHLWDLEPCYMKDLLAALPEPKPAKTTIATLLKRMLDKEVIGFQLHQNRRRYFARVSKQAYFGKQLRGTISRFFNGSPTAFASLLTDEADLTREQLESLQRMINERLKDTPK